MSTALLLSLAACATGSHAERIADPVHALAASAPAFPNLTTSTTRATALRASRSRTATTRPPRVVASGDLLDRLAMCESGMNPRAIGGGGRFFGAFQDTLQTWHNIGGTGNPIDFDYATQKALNARIPVSAWGRQFPTCARRLGVA